MSTSQTTTIIIGGSAAGSYLANILGQAGQKTILIEASELPRRKACGEGMAAIGKDYLEALGLWDDNLERFTQPFYGYTISSAQFKRIDLKARQGVCHSTPDGYTVRRDLFDHALFESAISHPSVSLVNQKVKSVVGDVGNWEVRAGKTRVRGENLVIACGAGIRGIEFNGAQIPAKTLDTSRIGLVLWYEGEWKDSMPEEILIKQVGKSQIILTPLKENIVNVSMLISKTDSKISSSDTARTFTEEALRFLAEHGFVTSQLIDRRGAASITSHVARPDLHGVYLIGDSAEVLDPIGGMGIAHAFGSATLAGNAILSTREDEFSIINEWQQYKIKRLNFSRHLRRITFLSYQLNVSQKKICLWFVRHFPDVSYRLLHFAKSKIPLIAVIDRHKQSNRSADWIMKNSSLQPHAI